MIAKTKEAAGQVQNMLDLLEQRVSSQPGAVAAKYKGGATWKEMTWADLGQRVRQAAEGFIRLGVKPGDGICIFAATRMEWVVADLAALAAGAVVVPIYASNTSPEAAFILENSGAVLCVVDSDQPDGRAPGRLQRIRQIWGQLPALKKVVVMEGPVAGDDRISSWNDVAAGTSTQDLIEEREKRTAALGPSSPATIIYTSGTTGNPKGVVLTHGNWVYEAESSRKIGLMHEQEVVLLFLPLAHSFAQVIKATWLALGFCLAFAESTEKVVDNCGEVHPTVLPAVPRIFEKVYNKVVGDGASASGLQGRLFRSAMAAFDEQATARLEGKPKPGFSLAKKLVFPKIKAKLDARLGGKLRLFVSGGAPLARKLAFFFEELGFEILEGYGLTETSAGSCINRPGHAVIGTVGPAFPGTELKIAPDGEIYIKGPGVMREYYRLPEATAEAIDKEGWFHTGDIGELDPAGNLRITDRKKDIIVTAGGKNVAPQNIENDLKSFPIVSQAMVYGDRRKFLSVLITVSEEQAKKIAADKSITYTDYADLVQKPAIQDAVKAAVDGINGTLPSYETLKRFAVLPNDFTQESGELTPTLKVKRKFATAKYKSVLDGFYDEKVME
jgi:long-chain acyl-CoA synthetase